MLSFFPRGVLDEILNFIVSLSEGFPSYSLMIKSFVLLFEAVIHAYVVVDGNNYNSEQKWRIKGQFFQ